MSGDMKFEHPNRPNKRKDKKGSGCAMCKPWKHKYGKRLTIKDFEKLVSRIKESY